MTGTKKLYVKTYGCQMNVYDSERMAEALGAEGYEQVASARGRGHDPAEHLPHPREGGGEGLFRAWPLKPLREANPDLKIGVAGCVAQAEGEEIMRRQPMVDLVVGPQTYHRLPKMMEALGRGEKALDTDFPEEDKFAHLPKDRRAARADGVPDGAGRLRQVLFVLRRALYARRRGQRPVERLMGEARDLVERGVREITLLGQNVNAYHGRARTARNGGLPA
jgi:tRNA-2-methylthio-N6-dimethylallyladenosine synthase